MSEPLRLAHRVTPHFTWGELTTTQSRDPLVLAEQGNPPAEIRGHLLRLAEELLEPARLLLGPIGVTSGYRCPRLNAAIGGSLTSMHMRGLAADLHPLRGGLVEAYERIASSDPEPLDQLILEFGRWIHLGGTLAERKPRHQLLMIWEAGIYLPFDPADPRVQALRTREDA